MYSRLESSELLSEVTAQKGENIRRSAAKAIVEGTATPKIGGEEKLENNWYSPALLTCFDHTRSRGGAKRKKTPPDFACFLLLVKLKKWGLYERRRSRAGHRFAHGQVQSRRRPRSFKKDWRNRFFGETMGSHT